MVGIRQSVGVIERFQHRAFPRNIKNKFTAMSVELNLISSLQIVMLRVSPSMSKDWEPAVLTNGRWDCLWLTLKSGFLIVV